jgi:hypothetical protein
LTCKVTELLHVAKYFDNIIPIIVPLLSHYKMLLKCHEYPAMVRPNLIQASSPFPMMAASSALKAAT